MNLFGRCFLLVFAQLYVGGMLTLSVPPFHQVARGFYKSTAGVYLGAGVLMLAGRITLLLPSAETTAPRPSGVELFELALWFACVIAGATYLRSLWGERVRLRANAYVVTWMSGILALTIGSQLFRVSPLISVETIIYPLCFILSALVLGGVSTGMLLGHWYLIDHDLAIDPFRSLFAFFVRSMILQTLGFVAAFALFALLGSPATTTALATLVDNHTSLLILRLSLSPLAAAAISWMIWKTLQIPQTMAATGLFYIAILAVLVGEMLGRFILFRTSLPL